MNFRLNDYHKSYFGILLKFGNLKLYRFLLTWDPITGKISKRYSYSKSQTNVFKPVLKLPRSGRPIGTLWIFLFFLFEIPRFQLNIIFF